jgi:hypothetical protein
MRISLANGTAASATQRSKFVADNDVLVRTSGMHGRLLGSSVPCNAGMNNVGAVWHAIFVFASSRTSLSIELAFLS